MVSWNLVNSVPNNVLSPVRQEVVTWVIGDILSIRSLGKITNFESTHNKFEYKMHLKMLFSQFRRFVWQQCISNSLYVFFQCFEPRYYNDVSSDNDEI